MEWLTQNWVWIILLIGMVLVMRRAGLGGCGMGHADYTRDRIDRDADHEPHKAPDAFDVNEDTRARRQRHGGCC